MPYDTTKKKRVTGSDDLPHRLATFLEVSALRRQSVIRFSALFVMLACLLVVGTTMVGLAAELEDRLVIYSPHGDQGRAFAEAFQALHPDVRVDYLFLGSQEVLDRIRAERANPQADIWWGAPTNLYLQAKRDGLLQPYRPKAADAIDEAYRDPDDYFYATFLTPLVLAYNTRNVAAEDAPRDWDELLDPKWEGRIIIRDPMAAGTTRTMYSAMIYRFFKDTGSPEQGFDWLRKLEKNVHSYSSHNTLTFQQLGRGVVDVTAWNLPSTVDQMQRGMPVDYFFPESGTPVIADNIAILAGAKHPNAAQAFYDFVTSEESLIRFATEFNRVPARNDLPKDALPDWMQEPMKALEIDWEVISLQEAAWMREWDETIRGRGGR